MATITITYLFKNAENKEEKNVEQYQLDRKGIARMLKDKNFLGLTFKVN